MELRHALIITLNISKIDLGCSLSQATISCQYCLLTGYSANLSLKHDMHVTDYLQYDWGCLPALYESVYLNLLRQMRFFIFGFGTMSQERTKTVLLPPMNSLSCLFVSFFSIPNLYILISVDL